ncbi:AAA family ATPase [Trichocoleus sp. ST-U3]
MRKITEVTRRDIVEFLSTKELLWYGRLEETEFLSRLYNLEETPSTDSRFDTARSDIWQHRINNEDWENDWIFFDSRFNLSDENDDHFFLKFLCETLHPIVRSNIHEIQLLLQTYNKLLSPDGYEIFEERKISGRSAFGFREIAPGSTASFHHFMSNNANPIQKILFGSPGTGKSYQIREIAKEQLGISFDDTTQNSTVKTVFHPEYTYADFMGKLLPLTQGNSIIYKFYPGHFLRVLGMAYQGLTDGNQENYLLVIDELNRGNAAAIFGTVFQLLDRNDDGWSSYEVDISEMELVGLLEAMQLKPIIQDGGIEIKEKSVKIPCEDFCKRREDELNNERNEAGAQVFGLLKQRRIKIPQNLSIIATINTSDESIYYLDSAFKRRWSWEYVKAPIGGFSYSSVPVPLRDVKLVIDDDDKGNWSYYIIGINEFIKLNSQVIRRIEDKQIGWWFIKPEDNQVDLGQVTDKLMFYLWDSVFARDKRPLEQFLSTDTNSVKLALYSDFLDFTQQFMEKVYELGEKQYVEEYF